MPITLAQAGVNTINDIDFAVIDDFRRNSWLMNNITFDDTVVPGTGGATLGYTYVRKLTGASAAPRAINTEYTPGQATRATYSVTLKPIGASFELDRVIARLGAAGTNEVTFQMMEAMVAVRERFVREFLYGDTATNANTFDGLSKALTGASTELTTSTNWVTIATQANALLELDKIDIWLSSIVPTKVGSMTPDQPGGVPAGTRAILGNTKAITQLKRLAKWANMLTMTRNEFDQDVESYRGWALIDVGDRADGSSPIIPITSNVSEVFAVSLGLDAAHAASPGGQQLVNTYFPDWSTSGAVKLGEIELGPAAFVLKSSKACGVYRNITVQ